MDLRNIYNELYESNFLSSSIDFQEFLAGFFDFQFISELRKDLIKRDYDVVDVVTFFESIVDEIPNLQKNDVRSWRIYSKDEINFFIVNEFGNSYDQYKQWIYYFNSEDDLELLSEIDSPVKFYSKNSIYLNSLPTTFESSFIDDIYERVTEPMIFNTFKSYTGKLCRLGKHREAKLFLQKNARFIKSANSDKLFSRVDEIIGDFNLYNEIKGKVLRALEIDDFTDAWSSLSSNFNSLSSDSYEDIESIIKKAENEFHMAISLGNKAKINAAQEQIARIDREKRSHEEMLESKKRFQSEQLNLSKQNLSQQKTASSNLLYIFYCVNCQGKITKSSNPSFLGCPSSKKEHRWEKLGEVGDINFQCNDCGLTIQTKNTPHLSKCVTTKNHNWYKL